MIEVHLMATVSFMEEAGIAQDTSLIFLAILTDPYDIILLECMLTDTMGCHVSDTLDLL